MSTAADRLAKLDRAGEFGREAHVTDVASTRLFFFDAAARRKMSASGHGFLVGGEGALNLLEPRKLARAP
jgi:hypothetical protein